MHNVSNYSYIQDYMCIIQTSIQKYHVASSRTFKLALNETVAYVSVVLETETHAEIKRFIFWLQCVKNKFQ